MKEERKEIAILGGGVGGCVAAFWLTATPELRAKYRVTLYQMGWRLGGKGASSRNPEKQWRSEEHGPHVWFGFYENAFRTLRECMRAYEALGETIGDRKQWTDLFEPSREGIFYSRNQEGAWEPWKMELETYEGLPGDGERMPKIEEMLWRTADHLAVNLQESGVFGRWSRWSFRLLGGLLGRKLPVSKPGECRYGINPGDPNGVASYLSRLLVDLAGRDRWYGASMVGRVLKWFLDFAGWRLRKTWENAGDSSAAMRELCLADLYRTCLRGALVDLLLHKKTFADLDSCEFLEWLKGHGALFSCLQDSPFLRGYYDTPFAYPGGDTEKPDFAAGAALRGFFRIFFGYKGAYLYRMTLGMGECVFVPFHRVLREQGVRFEFFHRVEELVPDPSGKRVASVRMTRQARLAEGVAEYDPLVMAEVPGSDGETIRWPVWPDRPREELLDRMSLPGPEDPGFESNWSVHPGEPVRLLDRGEEDGGEEEVVGRFDHLVFAIPPAAQRQIGRRLMEVSEPFRRMVETSETVRTMACQFWISGAGEGADGLGWDAHGHFCEFALAGASPSPLVVVLEATPILRTEATSGVRHLLYLCGPAPDDPAEPEARSDPGYPQRERARAEELCRIWLEEHAGMWPGVCMEDGRTLDWSHFHHPEPERGAEERRNWQYFRINLDPSERYVLSTSRSNPHRLAPADSGFANLVFAGDWCRNSIDIGCVESAATSAMLASHHLCGYPELDQIAGIEYR